MNRAGMRGLLEVTSEVPQGEKSGASSTHRELILFRFALVKAVLLHVVDLLMTSSAN